MKKVKDLFARLAITKVVKSDDLVKVKELIDAGEYDVDFTARFTGKITVGEDYGQQIVAKADPWKLLSVAMSKLNTITMASLVKDASTAEINTKVVKDSAQHAINAIKAPTLTVCKGKTTGEIEINVESASIKIVN